jgi:hypothetical protein
MPVRSPAPVKGVRRPATPIGPAKGVLRPATPIPPRRAYSVPATRRTRPATPGRAPSPRPIRRMRRTALQRAATSVSGNAEAAYQHANISNEYGIGDSSNPFSKAAMLQESYNRSKLGTTNSLAAQGQLYSGAMINAQNENASVFDSERCAQRAYGRRSIP